MKTSQLPLTNSNPAQFNYWESNGTYQELADLLQDMIPVIGKVNDPNSPALERLRKLTNAYHDLYVNGGDNPNRETAKHFPNTIRRASRNNWNGCFEITEPKMDRAVYAAAVEQGLVSIYKPKCH